MPERALSRPLPSRGAAIFVLSSFVLLVVATQVLWLSFAAISTQTAQTMGVSEGAVGDLATLNPAMFVLVAIPAGRWLDRHYSRALAAGAILTAAGALVRSIDPHSYGIVFAGQLVMSMGQPLVLNASTKIAPRYFAPAAQTRVIAAATAAQFLGILLAVLTSTPIYNAVGLRGVLGMHAGLAVVACVAVLISGLVPPLRCTLDTGDSSLSWLRHDRVIWALAGLLFIGVGIYNALATWLDSIMSALGHHDVAGSMIAATTIAGIAGAALLPGLVGARDLRRAHCLATATLLAIVMLTLCLTSQVTVAIVALVALGFMLLGTLPVVLDWSELRVGAARAGTATGFLLLAGNLGGVVVVLSVQAVVGHPRAALLVMAAWAVPGVLMARLLPRREHADSSALEGSPTGL